MSNKEKATKISWLTLAFMAFSTVWGFGNITNGFVYFNGPQVIFSWIFMFVLYFIPYALMVGELGSAFKNEGGGVSNESDEQLLHPLQQLVERETIPCSAGKKTRIVKAQLGNQAGIIGAALLGKKKRI